MARRMYLDLFIQSRGHQDASWRHPASSPLAPTDIRQLAPGDDVAGSGRT